MQCSYPFENDSLVDHVIPCIAGADFSQILSSTPPPAAPLKRPLAKVAPRRERLDSSSQVCFTLPDIPSLTPIKLVPSDEVAAVCVGSPVPGVSAPPSCAASPCSTPFDGSLDETLQDVLKEPLGAIDDEAEFSSFAQSLQASMFGRA